MLILNADAPPNEQASAPSTFPDYEEVIIEGHKYTAEKFEVYHPDISKHFSGNSEHPEIGSYPPANHLYVNMESSFVYSAPFLAEL